MNNVQIYFDLLNNFFDKIYVLTLEREKKRHQHIQKELEGLRYELFFGIDKKKITIEMLKEKGVYNEPLAIQHHRFNKPMSAGMIGCSWSHRNAYDDMIENKIEKALILEDDIIIDQQKFHLLPQVLTQLPKDWGLIYFGYHRHEKAEPFSFLKQSIYHIQRILGSNKFSRKTINNLYAKKISGNVLKAGHHDQTHAYGLTYITAKKLRQLQDPISFSTDNLLAYAITNHLVKAYASYPKLINQLSQNNNAVFNTSIGD